MANAEIRGRIKCQRGDGKPWNTIRHFTADNSIILRREMQEQFFGWQRAGMDMNSTFYGWRFKMEFDQ